MLWFESKLESNLKCWHHEVIVASGTVRQILCIQGQTFCCVFGFQDVCDTSKVLYWISERKLEEWYYESIHEQRPLCPKRAQSFKSSRFQTQTFLKFIVFFFYSDGDISRLLISGRSISTSISCIFYGVRKSSFIYVLVSNTEGSVSINWSFEHRNV